MKPPPRKVSVVRVEDHAELARGFRLALQQLPGLLPQSLPRQVVIKPNLCDILPWETGVTTDPRWIGILASELRSIRPERRNSRRRIRRHQRLQELSLLRGNI